MFNALVRNRFPRQVEKQSGRQTSEFVILEGSLAHLRCLTKAGAAPEKSVMAGKHPAAAVQRTAAW